MKSVFNGLMVSLSLFIGLVFLVVISLFGLTYESSDESPLYIITVLSINLYTCAYVLYHEFTHKKAGAGIPMILYMPLLMAFIFFLEIILYDVSLDAYEGKCFVFYYAYCVPTTYLALYCNRYNKFSMVAKHLDIITVICSIAVILNLPTMMSRVSIGGGGGHQEIAYTCAISFGIIMVSLFRGDCYVRYAIFKTQFYRYISILLLPVLLLIALMSGGRGGVLLLIINGILSFCFFSRKNFSKMVILCVVFVGVAYIVVSMLSSQMTDRFALGMERSFGYLNGKHVDMDATGREDIYDISRHLISESPIIGYGVWGTYKTTYAAFGGYSHNIVYDVLLQGGILGLVIFISVVCKVIKKVCLIISTDFSKSLLLPIATYPAIGLLFSGTWVNSALFWFLIVYVLTYKPNIN